MGGISKISVTYRFNIYQSHASRYNVLLDGVTPLIVHRDRSCKRVTDLDSRVLSYFGQIYCHLFATLLSNNSNFILVFVAIILMEADSRDS